MLLAAGLYTALVVTLNVIAQGGGSNLYPPDKEGNFTSVEISERIYGSKIVVISEQAMLNLVYTIKACMLVMYTRLTLGLTTQRLVKYLAAYTALGWLASQIAFFSACRPFQGYWGMPPPDPQCTTLQHYSIAQACFNISSDTLMLFVPLPLVMRTTMPLKQKAVLMFIFSMGLFVIVAALLTKIFNLTDVYDPRYMMWYVREASVAVYVSNLPMIWPLLREWFPFLSGLTPGGTSSGAKRKYGGPSSQSGPGGGGAGAYYKHGGSRNDPAAAGRRTEGGLGGQNGTGTRRAPRANSLGSLDSAYDLDLVLKDASTKNNPKTGKYRGDDSSSTEQIVQASEEIQMDGLVREGSRESIGVAVTKLGGIQVERTVVVHEEPNRDLAGLGRGGSEIDYSVGVGADHGLFDWQRTRRTVEHKADASRGGEASFRC
jgi:hypothetical protein